jgi:hypothetical protein
MAEGCKQAEESMIIHRSLFTISQAPDGFDELFGCHLYFTHYLPDERAGQIAPRMPGQCCCPSIRMSIKNVAAFLSDSHETHLE